MSESQAKKIAENDKDYCQISWYACGTYIPMFPKRDKQQKSNLLS